MVNRDVTCAMKYHSATVFLDIKFCTVVSYVLNIQETSLFERNEQKEFLKKTFNFIRLLYIKFAVDQILLAFGHSNIF